MGDWRTIDKEGMILPVTNLHGKGQRNIHIYILPLYEDEFYWKVVMEDEQQAHQKNDYYKYGWEKTANKCQGAVSFQFLTPLSFPLPPFYIPYSEYVMKGKKAGKPAF